MISSWCLKLQHRRLFGTWMMKIRIYCHGHPLLCGFCSFHCTVSLSHHEIVHRMSSSSCKAVLAGCAVLYWTVLYCTWVAASCCAAPWCSSSSGRWRSCWGCPAAAGTGCSASTPSPATYHHHHTTHYTQTCKQCLTYSYLHINNNIFLMALGTRVFKHTL